MQTLNYFAALSCMIVLMYHETKAQDGGGLVITYDLKTDDLHYDRTKGAFNIVGDAGNIVLKLKNINPFIYNVKISEMQNIRMDATQVGDINNMTFFNVIAYDVENMIYNTTGIEQTRSDPGDDEVSKLNASILKESAAISSKRAGLKKMIDEIYHVSNGLDLKKRHLQELTEKLNPPDGSIPQLPSDQIAKLQSDKAVLESGIQQDEKDRIALERRKSELENALLDYENKIALLEAQRDSYVKRNNSNADKINLYNQKVRKLTDDLRSINKIALFYRALVNMLYADGNLDTANIDVKKRNLLKAVFPSISFGDGFNLTVFLNSIINDSGVNYSEVSTYYNSIINSSSIAGNVTLNSQLRESFGSIKAMMAQIKVNDMQKFIDHIDRVYNSMNHKLMNSTYYANIINDDADFIRFTIEGTPVAGLPPSVNVRHFKVDVEVPIRGGVKLDLSTGLLNTFFLFNKTYRYEQTANASTYTVVENEQKSLLNPNLGLMLHVYRRNSLRNFRFSGSVGIGLSDDQNVRYFGGGSGIFGRKQRFILSMGVVAGQVTYADESVLNKELTLTSDDLLKPIPNRAPSPYRLGAFLGFTFNLSGSNSAFTGKMNGRGK